MKRDYDAIVVGASLGNLVLAALLSRQGQRVLLLEPAAEPQGTCSAVRCGDYVFELYPYLLWGLGQEGVLQFLLDDLEVCPTAADEHFLPQDPLYQIVLPDQRLSLFRDPAPFQEELRREFPADYPTLVRLYAEMEAVNRLWTGSYGGHPFLTPPKGEKQFSTLGNSLRLFGNQLLGKTCGRLLERLHLQGPAERFLDLQTLYFSGLPSRDTPVLALALIAGIPGLGCCTVKGGAPALAELLEQTVRRWGGEIAYDTRVESLLLEKRRVLGLKATYSGAPVDITSSRVVLNGLGRNRPDLLLPDHRQTGNGAGIPLCALFLGIDEEVVPEPMGSHVLFLSEPEKQGGTCRTFFLSLSPAWDASRSPQGKRALTVMTYLPDWPKPAAPAERDLSGEEIQGLIAGLEDLLPFLSRFVDFAAGRIFSAPAHSRARPWPHPLAPGNHWRFGGARTSALRRGLVTLHDSPFASQGTAPLIRSAIHLADQLRAS